MPSFIYDGPPLRFDRARETFVPATSPYDELLLSFDPLNSAFTTMQCNTDDETFSTRRYWVKEDVDTVLDWNAREANHVTQTGDMRRAARIPDMVQYEWWFKHGVKAWDPDHQDGVKRLLNDIDYRKLRTGGGYL